MRAVNNNTKVVSIIQEIQHNDVNKMFVDLLTVD